MAFNLEYTSKHRDVTYALTIAAEQDGDLGVDLVGTNDNGTVVAEGTLRLPPGGATETARLLREALGAISTFEGRGKRTTVGNAHARWTPDQDSALREAWLSQPPTASASEVIRALAVERERTAASIRARLPRVGCDPDVAGRLLTAETAALVGRDATVIT
ncbi:hypothetical protein [Actinokineospora sp. NBRC 105648]|uniref:hypothetical protein n=1 Tax=Actinokineospora sp. NBRC 105648 TaxID=3032206 RepID=UPI0024A1F8E5|nr:hypothetical protein [Actinokineospora sp. NBRC 105648]GLZ40699.1 hypothetical protein Acsp05_43230 [Actinokineospora sp. NBRC 105648]